GRRRHTRFSRDWSSDVCSSDLFPDREALDGDHWKMDFALTRDQQAIADSVRRLCEPFDDAYWLERDRVGGYPAEFHKALADAGWLGICMPEEYGGAGLGIQEVAVVADTLANTGGGVAADPVVRKN